jgi:cell division protein ZapE
VLRPVNPVVPLSLSSRNPELSVEQLIVDLVPPPTFSNVRFDTYIADATQPSQSAALSNLKTFAQEISQPRRRLFKRARAGRPGRYLDGGFGVGKTHLLASLWHEVTVPKVFGTFVEFTNLVGALGFHETVESLSKFQLICIDEFELDDPGDTVLMSTLLMRLVERGVWLAATSNTLPDRLGEERFAADDFVREIQGLANHFDTLRIDGEDYRHRGLPQAPAPVSTDEVRARAQATYGASLDSFSDLTRHLAKVHPSKFHAMVADVELCAVTDVEMLHDQAAALRWVVLADRLYDRDVPVINSGVPFDQLFAPELLRGGYRKKYRRAVSRLVALARKGAELS